MIELHDLEVVALIPDVAEESEQVIFRQSVFADAPARTGARLDVEIALRNPDDR